jgi:hypothetical protein
MFIINFMKISHWTGLPRGDALDLGSRGAQFESWHGHQLSWGFRGSSETLVYICRIIWHIIPEDYNLHIHYHNNPKFPTVIMCPKCCQICQCYGGDEITVICDVILCRLIDIYHSFRELCPVYLWDGGSRLTDYTVSIPVDSHFKSGHIMNLWLAEKEKLKTQCIKFY